jgi:hypothetical protein
MNIGIWAFFDVETGAEITRDWEGTEEQARALAQRTANERRMAVEFQLEPELGWREEGAEGPSVELVEPQ